MKVPKARKLPSGTWFIQLRLGGESIPVNAPTEKECTRRAQLIKAQYMSGVEEKKKAVPADLTLSIAIDDYIKSKSNVLSPATIRSYKGIQRNRFASVMDKPLKSVKSWQAVVNAEAKECSPKSLKNAWALVVASLKAKGYDVSVTLPPVPVNEHPFLTPEEVLQFIEAVKGHPVEIPALLALHSMRRSEILALDWKNVDLRRRDIYVHGSMVFNEEQKLVEKKTNKTRSSTRHIPILADALAEALEAVEDKTGKVVSVNANTIWAQVNRVCRANNLPEVGVHGLRHSFASLAYHLGFSEEETMRIGGWEDAGTMRKIYTHIPDADISRSQAKMAAFLNGSR